MVEFELQLKLSILEEPDQMFFAHDPSSHVHSSVEERRNYLVTTPFFLLSDGWLHFISAATMSDSWPESRAAAADGWLFRCEERRRQLFSDGASRDIFCLARQYGQILCWRQNGWHRFPSAVSFLAEVGATLTETLFGLLPSLS